MLSDGYLGLGERFSLRLFVALCFVLKGLLLPLDALERLCHFSVPLPILPINFYQPESAFQ